jgi:DNA uptake protein ComE-like DNA-binding protein
LLKVLKATTLRRVTLLITLSCSLLVAACGYGGENRQSNATNANTAGPAANRATGTASKAKLNLNTASENDFLTTIPGMGNRMVHEFLEYRPYQSVQQFRREIGKYVSADQVAEYEKYVYVPIAANESDAATLQQIPGLDQTEAEALIGSRPYASTDAFLAKLAQYVSEAELAVARTYLSNR